MLENITIIIPAHNRPERLQRLLDYYAATRARILVPDSSTEAFAGRYDKSTTVYVHTPRMHFLDKIQRVIHMIETPYVVYCADDDFAVPSGLEAAAAFLDANPDYAVAQGYYLTFKPRPDGRVGFSPRYIRHFTSRVTGDTPLERLTDRTPQYASLLYGLVRSDVFRQMYDYCYDELGRRRFDNLFLAEEFFCHATRIYGKYATVPVFFSAREVIPGSATTTTVPQSVVKNAPEYRKEYDGFIEALALMLCDCQPGMGLDDARCVVREANAAPLDVASVQFKRRVLDFCCRHSLLSPLVALMNHRYESKGRRAVAGLSGYPQEGDADLEAIVKAVRATAT